MGLVAFSPGIYLANQLDGKIFEDPSLLPSRTAYSQFVQTKVTSLLSAPGPCTCC